MSRTVTWSAVVAGLLFISWPANGAPSKTASFTLVSQADVKVGETVKDLSGQMVGVVKKVKAKGAVISTGRRSAEVRYAKIRRSPAGLVTSVTRADIDRLAEQHFEAMRGPEMPAMPGAM